MQRRAALAIAGTWLVCHPFMEASAGDPPTGWVEPALPPPPLNITGTDGRVTKLASAVSGKITAVQLMFTGCSATCPTQGALFAAIASRLSSKELQLLSISIDALGDTPSTLRKWQDRLGRHPAWSVAVADAADVDVLGDYMKGVPSKSGTHTAQVFIFDRHSRLRYRTGDSPAIREVEALMERLTQIG
jgi:protein SCO1/2